MRSGPCHMLHKVSLLFCEGFVCTIVCAHTFFMTSIAYGTRHVFAGGLVESVLYFSSIR